MKIIHVTPYYPPHLGGMGNAVKISWKYLDGKKGRL